MDSKELMRRLQRAGWVLKRTKGSHHTFGNPETGRIVVVKHPQKDVPIGTLRQLERLSGVSLR